MSDHSEELALEAAVTAAQRAAELHGIKPCEAAMEVMCAFLVARQQLRMANKEGDKSFDDAMTQARVTDALMTSVGFSAPDPVTVRAMVLLGLQPLLRIRSSSDPSPPAQPEPPRPDAAKTAAPWWRLRRP